jgi:hypothetical protein
MNDGPPLGSATDDTVAFMTEAVMAYLDAAIDSWRVKREAARQTPDAEKPYVQATHYIDAFQSVRVSLFGELKP